MIKQTKLAQIEITDIGYIFFKLHLQIADGDSIIMSNNHRSGVWINGDLIRQLEAVNNQLASGDIKGTSWPPVSEEDAQKIQSHMDFTWSQYSDAEKESIIAKQRE